MGVYSLEDQMEPTTYKEELVGQKLVGKKPECVTQCFWICPFEGEKQLWSVRVTWQLSDILSKLRDREKTIVAEIEQTATAWPTSVDSRGLSH